MTHWTPTALAVSPRVAAGRGAAATLFPACRNPDRAAPACRSFGVRRRLAAIWLVGGLLGGAQPAEAQPAAAPMASPVATRRPAAAVPGSGAPGPSAAPREPEAVASRPAPTHVPAATGEPPVLGAGARDLAATYPLPRLRDASDDPLAAVLSGTQVGRRARRLGLDARSALAAWQAADATLAGAEARLARPLPVVARSFGGSRASQLNALLRDRSVTAVRVDGARLEVDEPIVPARPGQSLDLGRAELRSAPNGPRFMLIVRQVPDVVVSAAASSPGAGACSSIAPRGPRCAGSRSQVCTTAASC